jgi:hypothetical protein
MAGELAPRGRQQCSGYSACWGSRKIMHQDSDSLPKARGRVPVERAWAWIPALRLRRDAAAPTTGCPVSKTPGSNPAAPVILPPSSRWTLRSHSSPTSPKSAMQPTNGKNKETSEMFTSREKGVCFVGNTNTEAPRAKAGQCGRKPAPGTSRYGFVRSPSVSVRYDRGRPSEREGQTWSIVAAAD